MAMVETIGVLVPADQIAKIIGKAGAGLKQIREAAGVKIQVQQTADPSASTRRVDLIGQTERIIGAFQLVLNKAFTDGTATPTLLIPSEKAGQVIGKGGDNLKKVREECHVRLQLEREPMSDPATGAQERLLTMSGETAQMARALRFILGTGMAPAGAGKLPTTLALPSTVALPTHAQVRAPSSDPDEIQLQFTIPEKFAGAILGKAGNQVKQTAVTAGCKVSMTTRGQGAERRAVIMGSYGQCVVAQGLLYDQLLEASRAAGTELTEVTVVFMVRKEAAGAVIGKQGSTLKQIRESSGAKVQLAREEVEGQRPCTLTGSLQGVLHAEKSIFDMVRQVPVAQAAYAGAALPAAPYAASAYASYDAGANKRADTALQPAPTAKRQRVDDAEPTTKLLVPAQCAGAVIGKQGSGLKEIRETTGAHVDMLQQAQAPQWPNERLVILKGSPAARQSAILSVLRMAYQMNSDSCALKMLVSGPQAGSIIGKQGNTLKYIREQCGIGVQVEREEVYGERLVTATGTQGMVSAAAIAICTVLDSQIPIPSMAETVVPPSLPPPLAYDAFGLGMGVPPVPTPGAYVQ
mmetsp:Transcript_31289/g.89784  ORF Transcript_31289/g.89784 Transcript_31289/m.89784 type:complete len:579 (+) Transcript_31289:95-1831(+)